MQDSLRPATFLQRLGAALVDFFVVAAYVYAVGWFCSTSKPLAQVLILPLGLGSFAYSLVTHARYGRTLGKWLVGIRVAQLSGSPIGWNESLRRSAVDGLFQATWTVGLFAALLTLPDESFSSQGWLGLHNELQPWLPSFVPSILIASIIWSWSEMLTMLFNRRRRAVHDLIASTIVIRGGA